MMETLLCDDLVRLVGTHADVAAHVSLSKTSTRFHNALAAEARARADLELLELDSALMNFVCRHTDFLPLSLARAHFDYKSKEACVCHFVFAIGTQLHVRLVEGSICAMEESPRNSQVPALRVTHSIDVPDFVAMPKLKLNERLVVTHDGFSAKVHQLANHNVCIRAIEAMMRLVKT